MRFKCAQCGHVMTAEGNDAPVECELCHVRLRPQGEVAVAPRPVVQPVVVQFHQPAEPFTFEIQEERLKGMREDREHRRESRQFVKDDRMSNPTGLAGFAINATAMLMLLSAWMFAKSLPAYLYIAASLAIPASLAGLILSLIGSLMIGRPRAIAISGIALGVPLLFFMIPLSFLLRDWIQD